ncbi:ubiquitin carboxyl-terminal hydrolase domain-containing protein [Ditylenchus destructor]|uniref:Ubiquitin carboxyl-terminal hydrolase domain-containing protein n=1 Tax=Ditylenchus destructor TaxID=166010 RepID=A0AAD4N066_9BILA|nr:ubiquitin carboxyl-terminal hydrolase domain-containing protein [Ditylenchus destructor]
MFGHQKARVSVLQVTANYTRKLDTQVSIPESLDMSWYMGIDVDQRKLPYPLYDLIGVVNHYGPNANSGHYTATTKNPLHGTWHTFDDQTVTKATSADFTCSENAYVLFYERRSSNHWNFNATSWYPHAIPQDIATFHKPLNETLELVSQMQRTWNGTDKFIVSPVKQTVQISTPPRTPMITETTQLWTHMNTASTLRRRTNTPKLSPSLKSSATQLTPQSSRKGDSVRINVEEEQHSTPKQL